jgi:mRNA interferase MazF
MRKPTVNCEQFDVVSVPFPFTDSAKEKRRPALVISSSTAFNDQIGHSVMAMITSAKNLPWPLDIPIADLGQSGLPAASVVRMKLFTLDHRLIVARLGALAENDRYAVQQALRTLLAF